MPTDRAFIQKFFAATTAIEKVQVCIRARRYAVWERADLPNLSSDQYILPILELPVSYPCTYQRRKTGGTGATFVIEFKYSVEIFGQNIRLYFKGFFTEDWTLKLKIQSLRENEEI